MSNLVENVLRLSKDNVAFLPPRSDLVQNFWIEANKNNADFPSKSNDADFPSEIKDRFFKSASEEQSKTFLANQEKFLKTIINIFKGAADVINAEQFVQKIARDLKLGIGSQGYYDLSAWLYHHPERDNIPFVRSRFWAPTLIAEVAPEILEKGEFDDRTGFGNKLANKLHRITDGRVDINNGTAANLFDFVCNSADPDFLARSRARIAEIAGAEKERLSGLYSRENMAPRKLPLTSAEIQEAFIRDAGPSASLSRSTLLGLPYDRR